MAGAKTNLLELFIQRVGQPIDKDTLSKVAGVHDWARVIRTLRQEGYEVELLKNGDYVLHSEVKKEGHARGAIDAKTRYRILHRDQSQCQRCGRTVEDGVKLAIDHKIPVEYGGETTDDNLWVLCEECNLGKKHWLSDTNVDLMRDIFAQPSAYKRIAMYFKAYPDTLIEPSKLSVVGNTREWTRELRRIRAEEGMAIKYIAKDPVSGKEGYIYETNPS